MTTKEIGALGEAAAAAYLEELGYDILSRNYTSRMGEIDLIAQSPDEVCVFVEVKTRRGRAFGLACEAVDRRKQEKIMKTALTYPCNGDMRFDVIEVYYESDSGFKMTEINHIENAFGA